MKNFYCLKAFHKCFLFFLLFFFSGSIGSGSALAQSVSQKIDLVCHNELMPSVLKKLEQETKFKFLFTYNELQHFKVTVEIKSKTIDEVMNAILASYPLTYKINGIYVTVSALQKTKQRRIKGRVVDIDGIPLPGVNILTNDISVAGVSDGDGNFDILIPDSKEIKEVRFSYIGMKTVSIPFAEKLFLFP